MNPGIGIIGCGRIGHKRAAALGRWKLLACSDIDEGRAAALSSLTGAEIFCNWREMLDIPELEAVVVATRHDSLAPISLAAIEAGKHVLVEKPAARYPSEIEPLIEASGRSGVKVRVGYNHRYHRAFRKAHQLFQSGVLGELMLVRGRYGHGGRPGYEKEWRAQPEISGGGELIDQGSHLIDLSRWFLGDFTEVQGVAQTCFWDMPVDDNAFMLLKTAGRQTAFLHASCTEWKNMFSMEIYGREGKLEISSLGGSYGVEKLAHYRMLPEMGPPETTIWEFPMEDDSFGYELEEFYKDIMLDREPVPGLKDAMETLKIISRIYRESGLDHHA